MKRNKGQDRSRFDHREVIRAYETDRLSLEECTQRFTTSTTTIKDIITAHGGLRGRPNKQRGKKSEGEAKSGGEAGSAPRRPAGVRRGVASVPPTAPARRRRSWTFGTDEPRPLTGLPSTFLVRSGANSCTTALAAGSDRHLKSVAAADGLRTADAGVRSAAVPRTGRSQQAIGKISAERPDSGPSRRA